MNVSQGKVEQKIKRWGNNIGLVIPKEIARELNLEEESAIYLEVKDGKLIIKPKKDLSLVDLLDRVNDENRHDFIDFGPPVGREKF
ncbi:MAG: AbrB/MazE/SpoVT family DNA-binding domain-containing protein [Alkalibacterium sp.]|uniref:Antitoxin MazE n=1 Tax=Alkalibacterium gilvum TaxID=1130080 RepID=A0A1H6V8S3_9LACT|nr:AbrB/MazE/SpoVT family DNA-binding domain-containing protein [Alkalibacterium gilvum]MDN6327698.1 AbrB/MazE/SpoVT family DNA-binding domain-containing protein [Alkalibacterium sp.]MDN6729362.1 AbrB/MazE/SpoVT family DNA-binding domain-containing protein [Alkalibacterium sp.]SEI96665.1 antitoxin MazE [Alkalibacterium gilvum]